VISGAGSWSVQYAAHDDPGFCLMLDGSCFLAVDGLDSVELEQGDFVLLPATPGFTMASDLRIKPTRGRPVDGTSSGTARSRAHRRCACSAATSVATARTRSSC